MDVPFHLDGFSGLDDGVRIRGGSGPTSGADDHAGAVDMEAAGIILHLVAEGDPRAVPRVRPDDYRLDDVPLKTVGHRARIPFAIGLAARCLIPRFLGARLIDIFGEDIHIPGIVIEPLVQRDLDLDHGDIEVLDRRVRRAPSPVGGHRLGDIIRRQEPAGPLLPHVLMHHGHGVVTAGRPLGGCILLHLLVHAPHETMVLELDLLGTAGPPFERILHLRLPDQRLLPGYIPLRRKQHR